MLSVLWEIVLPLLIAFAVGWLVMGWLTWRWRRADVTEAEWATVTAELRRAREQLAATGGPSPEPTVPASPPSTTVDLTVADARPADPAPVASSSQPVTPPPAAVATAPAPVQVDDLKAIRGVGVKMEAKLHDLGVTSLRQVAAFTDDDIARISAGIGAFPGRIERDRWVPQAKELVAKMAADAAAEPVT